LQRDLARAGIKPFAWVIEQSLLASGSCDPLLSLRGNCEIPFVRRVADDLAPRCALVPWLALPPVGIEGLKQLVR
jgi:arsenite-transporting ATPase